MGDRVRYGYLDGEIYEGRVAYVYDQTVTIECDKLGLSHLVNKQNVMCKLEKPAAAPKKPLHVGNYVRFRRKRYGFRMTNNLKTDHGIITGITGVDSSRTYSISSDEGRSYSGIPANAVFLVRETKYARQEAQVQVNIMNGAADNRTFTAADLDAQDTRDKAARRRRRRLNYMRRLRRAQ